MMKLNEKLGVPKNIVDISIKIKKEISKNLNDLVLNSLDYRMLLNNNNVYKINIGHFFDLEVNDTTFNHVPFYIKIIYEENADVDVACLLSAGYSNLIDFGVYDNKIKLNTSPKESSITIDIVINQIKNIKDSVIREVNKVDSKIIAHEIMHMYDLYKKKKEDIHTRADYYSYQNTGLPPKLNEFLHLLYYTSNIENIVRIAEIYTDIVENNIKRKDFKKFVDEHDIIDMLKTAKNFSLENFKKEISNDKILHRLVDDAVDDGYKRLDENNIAMDVLNLTYINLVNKKITYSNEIFNMYHKLTMDISDIFGLTSKVDMINKQFTETVNKYLKYKDNPEKYFEYLEKYLNFTGEKMYRKVYKLYGMLNENNCIINWDLFQKTKKDKIHIKLIDFEKLKLNFNLKNSEQK